MLKLFAFAAIALLIGCKHEKVPGQPVPEITITSPAPNTHFSNGDTIHIAGMVTHSIAITEVGVHMVDLSNDNEFFHNHYSAGNATSFEFDAEYVIPNDVTTTYRIEVEVTDVNNNLATEDIEIRIN